MRTRIDPPAPHGRCATCGEIMPREFWYGRGPAPAPLHCTGSPIAYARGWIPNPHHGRRRHPDCWHCHQPMGCDQCVSSHETLCRRCAVFVYPDQLARLGPIVNDPVAVARRHGLRAPQVEDYPRDFQAAFHAFHASCPADCWHRMVGAHRAAVAAYLAGIKSVPDLVDPHDQLAAEQRRRALHHQLELLTQGPE